MPRDFVEYPSQVNEMWAWEPRCCRRSRCTTRPASRCRARGSTRCSPPGRTARASRRPSTSAAALLDQAWHRLVARARCPTDSDEVEAFEAAALERAGVAFAPVPPRYRTTYFNHVFGGGYSAGYYSYIWSEVLDADTVEWFGENGGLRRENGDTFRAELLSRGGSVDPMEAFRDLRGRDPLIEPLLVRRGLTAARSLTAPVGWSDARRRSSVALTAAGRGRRHLPRPHPVRHSNYGDGTGPGERAAAEYVMGLLHDVGLEPELFESAPGRANVVVRLEGADPSRPALVAARAPRRRAGAAPTTGPSTRSPPRRSTAWSGAAAPST